MTNINHYINQRARRRRRVRSKITGTAEQPRLSVFRSNKFIYTQVIDDVAQKTLAAVNDLMGSSKKTSEKGSKTERAEKIALELAKKLKAQKISKLSFDRGHYKYHGRVKKIAEVLRENGIKI